MQLSTIQDQLEEEGHSEEMRTEKLSGLVRLTMQLSNYVSESAQALLSNLEWARMAMRGWACGCMGVHGYAWVCMGVHAYAWGCNVTHWQNLDTAEIESSDTCVVGYKSHHHCILIGLCV